MPFGASGVAPVWWMLHNLGMQALLIAGKRGLAIAIALREELKIVVAAIKQ